MLLPQLFFPGILEIYHAVFESLNLLLTHTPVLVFRHALLHCIMDLSTAGAGYHLIHGVILILIIFTAAVVGGRGCHPIPVEDSHNSNHVFHLFCNPKFSFYIDLLLVFLGGGGACKCCKSMFYVSQKLYNGAENRMSETHIGAYAAELFVSVFK